MSSRHFDRVAERFPVLGRLSPDEHARLTSVMHFPVLEPGAIAYVLDAPCPNYLMCIEGRTRVFKTSEGGREMLLYTVEDGATCGLTTQCLLSHTNFPAESVAERRTLLAAIPAASFHTFLAEIPAFRDFVLADYTKLLGSMFSFVDALAFQTIEQRLARRLLVDAGEMLIVDKTHQQLAADIGSVREIVSRQLGVWEKKGWVDNGRGHVRILDRSALASRRAVVDA